MKQNKNERALEGRARRMAKKNGFAMHKSRRPVDGIDNNGGFMLADAELNCVVRGRRYELTPDDIINICSEDMAF